ncbi:MAG: hypothetical protein IIA72_10545 [Proteobacteria bacterium]|nr:hypothetical protein [Pseudomonadota bacterium]
MGKRYGLYALILVLSVISHDGFGDQPSKPQSRPASGSDNGQMDPRARFAIILFGQTCLRHIGKPARLRDKLSGDGEMRLPELPEAASKVYLGKHPGKAWSASHGRGGFIVTQRDDGLCTVFVEKVIEADMLHALEQLFRDIGWFGLTLVKESENRGLRSRIYDMVPKGEYRKRLARSKKFGSEPIEAVFQLVVSTTQAEDRNFQAAISVADN